MSYICLLSNTKINAGIFQDDVTIYTTHRTLVRRRGNDNCLEFDLCKHTARPPGSTAPRFLIVQTGHLILTVKSISCYYFAMNNLAEL